MVDDARLLQALLRNDFRAFVDKVFTTLCPGQTYIPTWHVEAIAHKLERVRRGEIRRLIINMPPRSLKSLTVSVSLPAFLLGLDPTRRLICVSYSGDLAKKHANAISAPCSKRPGIDRRSLTRGSGRSRTRKPRSNSPRADSVWRHRSAERADRSRRRHHRHRRSSQAG